MDPYGVAGGSVFVLLGLCVIAFRERLTRLAAGNGAEGEVHYGDEQSGRWGGYVFGGLATIAFGFMLLLGSLSP